MPESLIYHSLQKFFTQFCLSYPAWQKANSFPKYIYIAGQHNTMAITIVKKLTTLILHYLKILRKLSIGQTNRA